MARPRKYEKTEIKSNVNTIEGEIKPLNIIKEAFTEADKEYMRRNNWDEYVRRFGKPQK